MTTPEWWSEHKCPICGYITTVTNICRQCKIWMFATGFEEQFKSFTINLLIYEYKRSITKRRKMTKHSETYDNAVISSHFARQDCEKRGVEIPEWAWFG